MYFSRQLAARYDEIQANQAELLIVGRGEVADAQRYARLINARSPVLADPDLTSYDAFMLDRAMLALIQKSGAFVIDRAGVIQFGLTVANPLKWMSGDVLTRTLQALAAPTQTDPNELPKL
jgi:peroxiredoxin